MTATGGAAAPGDESQDAEKDDEQGGVKVVLAVKKVDNP